MSNKNEKLQNRDPRSIIIKNIQRDLSNVQDSSKKESLFKK